MRRALHREMSSHQLRELGTDGQAEAASAKAPGDSTVGLSERPEDIFLLFFGNADAGVGNLED